MNNKSQKHQNSFNKAHIKKQTTHREDKNNSRSDYSLTDYAKALYENIQNVFAKEILPDGIDFKTALDNTINNLNTKIVESADNIAASINDYTGEDNYLYKSRESYVSNIIAYISSSYTDRIDLQDGNKLYIYVDSEEDGLELVESIRSVFSDELIDELDFDYYVITDYSDADNDCNNDNDYCHCMCEENSEDEDVTGYDIEQDENEIDLLDFALINIAEDFGGKYNERTKTISFPDEETKNEYYLFIAELFENEEVLDLITGEDDGGDGACSESDNEHMSEKENLDSVFKNISQKINNKLNDFVDALEEIIKEKEEKKQYCCQNGHSNYSPEKETLIEEIFSCLFSEDDSITEYYCINCDCCETCVHCVKCGKCDTCDNQPTFE